MKQLFSPWRSKYIETFSKPPEENGGCVFCNAAADSNDEHHLIIARGTTCFVIMNLYPYNSGHVMVVPYRHTGEFTELDDAEMLEVSQYLRAVVQALREIARPEGFNLGSNLGKAAGAGIEQHVHFHVVPRWTGDTNFMPVLSDTKMISQDMHDTWQKLREKFHSPRGT